MNTCQQSGFRSACLAALLACQLLTGASAAPNAGQQAFLPLVVLDSFVPSRGELDPSFGEDGIVSTNFGPHAVAAINDLALQADGKIVAAGHTEVTDYYNFDFTLARYHPDGSLDTSFGDGGSVVTDITFYDSAEAVVIQPDGKILAAGLARDDETYLVDAMLLARYLPDGSPDASFGQGGVVLSDFGLGNAASDLALQADGKILVAGYTYFEEEGQYVRVFALARYHPDGSLDTGFDGDGLATASFSAFDDMAYSLALQPDGKVLVAGGSVASYSGEAPHFALARFNPDGSLDNTFDGDGKLVITDMGSNGEYLVALQADGKIVVAYGSDVPYGSDGTVLDFILQRFNPDGSLDTGFGEAGRVRTDWGGQEYPTGLAVQPDGRILAAGCVSAHGSGSSFVLARYQPDGSLDESFGYYGQVLTDITPDDYVHALALQRDGKILLAGSFADYLPVDFALLRYR